MRSPIARYSLALVLVLLIGLIVLIKVADWTATNALLAIVWAAGAAAFGLLSGYTTGASKQPGTAAEFLKFLGAGIIVPLIGGIVSLVQRPQTVTENYKYYPGGTLTESKTTATTYPETGFLHPLFVFALFLCVYGLFSVLGIMLGSRHRQSDVTQINIAPG